MRIILFLVGSLCLGGLAGCDDKYEDGGYGIDTDVGDDTAVDTGGSSGTDSDRDGVADADDCRPEDAASYPGAAEVCDGADNDCDGESDEDAADATAWYADADEDSYGDASASVVACDAPAGYVANDADCDDADFGLSPDAAEICDGIDNDCDGETDMDAVDETAWYYDADDDEHGDPARQIQACEALDGYVAIDDDCDDADSLVHPGMDEFCDGIDNDCDGTVDEDAVDAINYFFLDGDGDGVGQDMAGILSCDREPPDGAAWDPGDCDDTNPDVNPWAQDICDGIDNDCDGAVDDWEADGYSGRVYYYDLDDDGWGGDVIPSSCADDPEGSDLSMEAGDCDDASADVSPEAAEVCGNSIDDDCDGRWDRGDPEGCVPAVLATAPR